MASHHPGTSLHLCILENVKGGRFIAGIPKTHCGVVHPAWAVRGYARINCVSYGLQRAWVIPSEPELVDDASILACTHGLDVLPFVVTDVAEHVIPEMNRKRRTASIVQARL